MGALRGEETFFATVLVVKSWRPSSDNESGLPIKENEIIDVEDTETIESWRDDTWWYGSKVGTQQSGWFPSANTKIIQHKPPLEAGAVVDSKYQDDATKRPPPGVDGTLSTLSVPPRCTMRALRPYTGPGTQVAIDGVQDPEAATCGPFKVEKDDVVQVHTSKVRETALLEEFEDVLFCKNLRTGEYGWVPCSHLQEMRRGSSAQLGSAPNITSHALGGTISVLSLSAPLSRASLRVAAPDWVIQHASASSAALEGYQGLHSGHSSSQSTSPSGRQDRGHSGSGSVSSRSRSERSRSSSHIGTLPMLSPGTTGGHGDCEQRPVGSALKSRHRRGRPEKLQLANEFHVGTSTSSDDDDCDCDFDQAAAFSDRGRSCDMPRASRTDVHSPSPRSGDDLLQRFRSGDVPHSSPMSRGNAALSSQALSSMSPQTKPKRSPDQIAVHCKAPLEIGQSGNRFHHETGRDSFIARTLQTSSSSPSAGRTAKAHSLPSSPVLKPLGETSSVLHPQSQDAFNGTERKPNTQMPAPVDGITRLRPPSRSGGGSRVATEAYSSMMSALLSPPRSFVLPGGSAALPSIGASTSPANPIAGAFELAPSALGSDHTTLGSSKSSQQIATIGRSRRPIVASARQSGMDLDSGDDEDTTLAWLLQQQEVARVHGTSVAYDAQRSQQVLDEFLVQNSPTNRSSGASATRQRECASANYEPVQASGNTPVHGATPNNEASNGGMECIICFDNTIDTALYPCWHIICCSECAKRVTKCPQCRRKIKFRQRVFIK